MPRYDVGAHVIVSPNRQLGWYMPGLAVSLAAKFGFQPGQKFLADLFAVMKNDVAIFEPDLGQLGRRMRLERLLDTPVQIDDMVLKLEVDDRERMYQKTKRVVLERGQLADPASFAQSTTRAGGKSVEPPAPTAQRLDTYVDSRVAAQDHPSDGALSGRVDAVERVVAEHLSEVVGRLFAMETALAMDGVPETALRPDLQPKKIAGDLSILSRNIDTFMLDIRTRVGGLEAALRDVQTRLAIPHAPAAPASTPAPAPECSATSPSALFSVPQTIPMPKQFMPSLEMHEENLRRLCRVWGLACPPSDPHADIEARLVRLTTALAAAAQVAGFAPTDYARRAEYGPHQQQELLNARLISIEIDIDEAHDRRPFDIKRRESSL